MFGLIKCEDNIITNVRNAEKHVQGQKPSFTSDMLSFRCMLAN